jgi:hypothetical protein
VGVEDYYPLHRHCFSVPAHLARLERSHMPSSPLQPQRTVIAPSPMLVSASVPLNRVLSVVLAADEDVEWTWSSTEGASYVSGYTIVKRETRGSGSSVR